MRQAIFILMISCHVVIPRLLIHLRSDYSRLLLLSAMRSRILASLIATDRPTDTIPYDPQMNMDMSISTNYMIILMVWCCVSAHDPMVYILIPTCCALRYVAHEERSWPLFAFHSIFGFTKIKIMN